MLRAGLGAVRRLSTVSLSSVMTSRVPCAMSRSVRPACNGFSFPRLFSTKTNDVELVNFLKEEITTEKKSAKPSPLPSKLEEFGVSLEESEVTFTRSFGSESITIHLNVNHTIDSDFDEEVAAGGQEGQEQQTGKAPQEEGGAMQSRPNFEVTIKKGNQSLCFNCAFIRPGQDPTSGEEYDDVFAIEEISLYEGEWKEKVYAVAGDILDGYLYDLFMNMLQERGISSEFMEKLSDFCTQYEHQLYIGFLGRLIVFESLDSRQ